jgi:hypothetical protein
VSSVRTNQTLLAMVAEQLLLHRNEQPMANPESEAEAAKAA